MTPFVVALSGSPSPTSKTARCADYVLSMIAESGAATKHIRLSELNPESVIRGNLEDPSIKDLLESVSRAHGIVIATPIFKASYSGLLKACLDILPQFGFCGKVVLPIGTGGSLAHVLALDYGLRPVLQSMAARHITQSHFFIEADMTGSGDTFAIQQSSDAPLRWAVKNFLHSLTVVEEAKVLGHPRPVVETLS